MASLGDWGWGLEVATGPDPFAMFEAISHFFPGSGLTYVHIELPC